MSLPQLSTSSNGSSNNHHKTARAAKDQQRIERLRAKRRSREWEVRLTHEFIQVWARILHATTFGLFVVLEMFADWRPGPNHGHTGGHQTLSDLAALTGMDKNSVRRSLAELCFYGLIVFPVGDSIERIKAGCAVDIVVKQDIEAPKVIYRQQFKELNRLDSMSARRHRVLGAEGTPPRRAEGTPPRRAEGTLVRNAEGTPPRRAEGQESIALDSSQRHNFPSSSLGPQPPNPTTTDTHPQPDQEAETLFKLLPGYFDLQATADLLRKCRALQPDCTLTEILDFVGFKTPLIHRGRIKNPVGFLLAAVPEAMRGYALTGYRASAAAERAADIQRQAQWENWKCKLDDFAPSNGNGTSHKV